MYAALSRNMVYSWIGAAGPRARSSRVSKNPCAITLAQIDRREWCPGDTSFATLISFVRLLDITRTKRV